MLNRLFAAAIVFACGGAQAWTTPSQCLQGQIKTRQFGQESLAPSSYCTNQDGTELISQSCTLKNPCRALAARGSLEKSEIQDSPVGTLGFHLCTKLKAKPEIIEFKIKSGEWVKLDRCLFNDGSYIDVGSLMEITYK